MKEIIVEVSNEGEIKLQTRGFKGKSCIEETRFLKDLLGRETQKQLTPAYFQTEEAVVRKYLPLCG